jgi:hypothetical protein
MVSDTSTKATVQASTRPVISWGAVFGGAVVGLAVLALLTSLWLALAFESGREAVRQNLPWYVGVSALACLFLGGLIAGYLSGVRSAASGILHGWALWGLLMIVTIAVGIPSVLNIFGLVRVQSNLDAGVIGTQHSLWATFWTILGGFVAAGLGGLIGGAAARERGVTATAGAIADRDEHRDDHRDDVDEDDHRRVLLN